MSDVGKCCEENAVIEMSDRKVLRSVHLRNK